MIRDIAPERTSEMMDKVKNIRCKELGYVYMMAFLMDEANATPRDVLDYIESRFIG